MNISTDIIMVFSSIGVLNSIFFIIILLNDKKGHRLYNTLFFLIIISFTIRIGKSVLFYFSGGLPDIIINLGFAAFLSAGPSLFLYTTSLVKHNFKIKPLHLLNYFPGAAVLALSPLIPYTPGSALWQLFYILIIFQIFLYILVSYLTFRKSERFELKNELNEKVRNWLLLLHASISLIWLAYFFHSPVRIGSYINGAAVYSAVIYLIIYKWFDFNKKGAPLHTFFKTSSADKDFEAVVTAINKLMDEKVYTDPSLTLTSFSKKVNQPPYVVSRVINSCYNKNFNELVNSRRIEESKNLLLNEDFFNKNIAAVAYEVGFNSLSAFNSAFKKLEKTTPSEFRAKQLINL